MEVSKSDKENSESRSFQAIHSRIRLFLKKKFLRNSHDALNTQTDFVLMFLATHSLNSVENEEDEHILSSSEIPLKFKVQNTWCSKLPFLQTDR